MSRYEKVSNAFRMPEFLNPLYDRSITTRTTYANSFGPKATFDIRTEPFRSTNCGSKPRLSIEKVTQAEKCTKEHHNMDSITAERKRKRKSFFERVCGNKAAVKEINASEPICFQHKKESYVAKHDKQQSVTSVKGSDKLSVQVNRTGGVCGSTSTVDSSYVSVESKIQAESTCTTKQIPQIKIKKTRLSKNTNSKLDFVPLRDHFSNEENNDYTSNSSLKRFNKSKFRNSLTDFTGNLEQGDGKWADIEISELDALLAYARR